MATWKWGTPKNSKAVSSPRTPKLNLARYRSVVRVTALVLFVIGSLLTFPNAIPWMIAAWLMVFTWAAIRRGRTWLPLAGWIGVVVVKNLYWSPGLAVLVCVAAAVLVFEQIVRRREYQARSAGIAAARSFGRARIAAVALIWIAWAGMTWDWYRATHSGQQLVTDTVRPVVCMGDSLSSGFHPDGGYAPELQKLVSLPVVDLSQAGISTKDVIQLRSQMAHMVELKPQIVVLEIGGHDFLRGRSRAETKVNLEVIIDAAERAGARVILFEIPRGFIFDPYGGLERQIARERNLDLIPDTAIRRLVLWSTAAPPGIWMNKASHLSDDGLHPNALGNRLLARYVADVINRLVLGQVVSSQTSTR